MSALKNTLAIFKREFFSYFNSPVAYVILVIFLLAAQGFTFFLGNRLLDSNDASLTHSFFMWHPWIYMVLAPEEHRLGTMELLMTMPLSPWHAILGKFLAAATVWVIALALTFPVVWTVYYLGEPDSGPIISAYLGSYLYALSCLAVTSAVSAFTRSQVICFVVSVAICLLLTLFGWPQITDAILKIVPGWLEWLLHMVSYLCLLTHFYEMSKGLIVLSDVLYFLSVIVIGLMVTHFAIESRRS
jgi:ABC-2 type transport system permease protein